jgi:phosphatidylserine decarboxylase
MRLDRAAVPYLAATLVPAAVLVLGQLPLWGTPFLVLAALFGFFFRDPNRRIPEATGSVLAPADGRVLVAGPAAPEISPPGAWDQISIFLSPLDVHINRAPVAGRVTKVDYRPGRFFPAYDSRAAVSNERSEIWIDGGHHTVVCRQVAGALARRVVCRAQPGMELRAGEKFGLIKFGSRTDLFLPPGAVLLARPGQRVRGGETVLATFSSGSR